MSMSLDGYVADANDGVAEVGAMLTGRRTFERANGWGGQHPCDVPAFVVTHNVPDGWTIA